MGKKFSMEDLPKDLESTTEKEEFIRKEIKKAVNDLNSSGKASTEIEIRIGSLFNVLKMVIKKKDKEWVSYFEEKFPYLILRTVQRHMKLAKRIDLDKYPKLSFAGQTRLLALLRCVPKKGEVADLLKKHKVDMNFDLNKPKAVDRFRQQIDDVIKKERPSKKSQKISVSASLKRIKEAAGKWKDTLMEAKDDVDLLKPVEPDLIKRAIKGTELLLEQLKAIKKRVVVKEGYREAA